MIVSMSDYWSLFTASLVYGFAFGMIYAQVPVIMLEVSGVQRYPRAVGLLNLIFGVAELLCGILGGKCLTVIIEYTFMEKIVLPMTKCIR